MTDTLLHGATGDLHVGGPTSPAMADRLISPRTGPIAEVLEYLPERGEPREWRILATGSAIDAVHGTSTPVIGEGRGARREDAWQRCLNEFAERLALREPSTDTPSGTGCPLAESRLPSLDLADGGETAAPMADYYLHPRNCPLTGRTTSSGAATGRTFWEAVERGLLELLERDALVTAWRYHRPGPRVPEALVRDDVDRLRRAGLRAEIANLSALHDIPTAVCVVSGTARSHPVRTVGSASDRTLARAASRAIAEATAAYSMCVRRLLTEGDAKALTFTEPADNAYYYLRPERQPRLDRFFTDSEDASARQLRGSSRTIATELARHLAARRIKTVAADITPRWQQELGLRTVVTRSPDLFPFELGAGDPATARRLVEHPSRRGLDRGFADPSPIPLA